jgi:hypothetical protein
MMKKFLDGLIFGCGFAFALAAIWTIWTIGMAYFMPRIMDSVTAATREPEFKKPVDAKIVDPVPGGAADERDFSFFKHSADRMKLPPGGGILAMSPMTTAKGSRRPSTYQLWLTDSKLWQIRTVEEKVEIEQLPYPANASVTDLDGLMRKSLGFAARQSTMTVSADELSRLKSADSSSRDDSLNGKLRMTVEGVVFVQPNPYGT